MATQAQIKAKARNWEIYMFRGMANRISAITRDIFNEELTNDERIALVKINDMMNKKLLRLDEIKKHKHSYRNMGSSRFEYCDCGKMRYNIDEDRTQLRLDFEDKK